MGPISTTSPSDAHQQPWTFLGTSHAAPRRQVHEAAEREVREFHEGRAPGERRRALAPLGTEARTPYRTSAPWLPVLFRRAPEELAPRRATSPLAGDAADL